MPNLQHWLGTLRPNTLLLSSAGVIAGNAMAFKFGAFQWTVALLTLTTAISLQILSNVCNDYGDYTKGTDDKNRKGPIRALQTGHLTLSQIKGMIICFLSLSAISGTLLIILSSINLLTLLIFAIIGVGAIAAAIKYTMGKNPYGYSGMGDIFVFIFFGPVCICGTFFLQTQMLPCYIFLPAIAFGLLNIGVLNLNNLRDEENDRLKQKKTVVVLMGKKQGIAYQLILLTTAFILFLCYALLLFSDYHLIFFSILLLIPYNGIYILKNTTPENLQKSLRLLALSTFLIALFFALAHLL